MIPLPKPMAAAEITEITPMELSFDMTYSKGFTGEIAILFNTLSLFSKKNDRPHKIKAHSSRI